MYRFRKVFSNQHVILPVIHVTGRNQALQNVNIAFENGCDGVFLINHNTADIPYLKLLLIHRDIRASFPDKWMGINCLDLEPASVVSLAPEGVSGVWTDNSLIDEDLEVQKEAEGVFKNRVDNGWFGLYFGGVAFKYQKPVKNLEKVTLLAKKYMDVVTTSGPATGKSADIEKIKIMRSVLGDYPLAIASGITPENVTDYLPIADCFLVATGISKGFTELDPVLVKRLVENVRKS
jgi:uncharacterized protein